MEASRVGRDYCTSSQNSDVSGSSVCYPALLIDLRMSDISANIV